ncbi:TonB-dependent receptor [Cellvibrio sp. QJXJ]|uniref:TonB-dependent receptor n=1 Tax=Cellvibrio sp. QJXJ TaxID=2964606 RepID=UPI0021C3CE03|nr:TonB-dependent receptor [Cellvibrio sp. QJXJ]UUA71573.1 TonB-dependent receptor [Cellvibrio sp. QJXJ]
MHKKRLLPLCIALVASGQLYAQEVSNSADVEEVTVTGVRRAELNAREAEREKNIFSSVISQDDAGNFADQNVAESLQRLPGITLQKSEGEGKFVSVRGLGPGFVTVQQNGSELATAGDDGRAFALDAIPADLLGAIEVFKSLTPDMDLNSIGGVVNVKTVSAFDRKKDSLRLNVQDYYQDYSEEHSPKISIQGTNLFADDTIGLGYSLSWEERKTVNQEMIHHETTDPRFVPLNFSNDEQLNDLSSYMLIPFEFQNRQEVAERERKAMSLDFGYRPTENSEYYLRTSYTQYTDLDLAWREYYRFGQAQQTITETTVNGVPTQVRENDIAYLDRTTSTFAVLDTDIQQQMFIQETDNTTKSYSLGGKNIFEVNGGEYTVDYDYTWSEATSEKPDGRRVQFRVRDVPVIARFGKDFIRAQAVGETEINQLPGVAGGYLSGQSQGYGSNGISMDKFLFDNLFVEDASRADELDSFNFNLKRDYSDGWLNYWKTGVSVKNRTRERDQDRWSLAPNSQKHLCLTLDAPLSGTCSLYADQGSAKLLQHETAYVDHPSFVYPAITYAGAENLLNAVNVITSTSDTQQGLESIYRDYTLTEDSLAFYFMGEFNLAENQSLIVGARWDQTEFFSDGYFAINNDNFDLGSGNEVSVDYSIPMLPDSTKYDNWLPSIHYRFEPREDILIRSSIWTSFTRPSFDQARTFANLESNFSLCNPSTGLCSTTGGGATEAELKNFTLGSDNTLRLGNPSLVAMTSTNYDASIGWYFDESLFMQAAIFYKDIADYIVDVQGVQMAVRDLPVRLPIEQVEAFTIPQDLVINNVNTTVNGDNAKVYGIEFTFVKNFDSGLFLQSNMTFMNSEARMGDSIRVGTTQLPEQADTTANMTFGWENEVVSLRLSGNYNSKILKRLGACPAGTENRLISTPDNPGATCKIWSDVYLDETIGVDFKATYQVTDELKVYFDALNITDQYMTKYFQGNEYSGGKIMYHNEAFGRSFQVGLNYKFM